MEIRLSGTPAVFAVVRGEDSPVKCLASEPTSPAPAPVPASRVREPRRLSSVGLRYTAVVACLLALPFCGHGASSTGTAAAICPPAAGVSYVLPYPPPGSFLCSQGYLGYQGPYPHPPQFRYAFDFDMPIGTVVTAARDGIVEFVEEGFPDGFSGAGTDNVVVIDHGDGTYSRYAHLTRNGALVRRGQSVTRGDSIGHSGSSGTPFPHLHFDVTRGCSTRECQTMPVCFSNTIAHPAGLETGVYYPARPY